MAILGEQKQDERELLNEFFESISPSEALRVYECFRQIMESRPGYVQKDWRDSSPDGGLYGKTPGRSVSATNGRR